MKLIFITHNHSDHSFGLHSLLRTRSLFTNNKVQLFCDSNVFSEIQFYEWLYDENSAFNIEYIDSDDLKNKEFFVIETNNLIKVKAVDVHHTSKSKGCLITINNEWKIAYSGDRKALGQDHFVEEIGEVDLLIHESTFSSELDTEMDNYDHSTVNHAIKVKKQMNAKYMALVHISYRYDSKYIPCPCENTFMSFDYLSFSFDDIDEICKTVNEINHKCLNSSNTKN